MYRVTGPFIDQRRVDRGIRSAARKGAVPSAHGRSELRIITRTAFAKQRGMASRRIQYHDILSASTEQIWVFPTLCPCHLVFILDGEGKSSIGQYGYKRQICWRWQSQRRHERRVTRKPGKPPKLVRTGYRALTHSLAPARYKHRCIVASFLAHKAHSTPGLLTRSICSSHHSPGIIRPQHEGTVKPSGNPPVGRWKCRSFAT